MSERLFLRQNGVILGPFPVERLHAMLTCGQLAPDDSLSADKVDWRAAADYFVEALPEEKMPAPEVAQVAEAPTPHAENAVEKSDAATPETVKVAPFPQSEIAAEKPRWYQILAVVITQIWNAPGALPQLAQLSGKSPVGAGWETLGLALGLITFGNLLFGGRYAPGCGWVCIISFANFVTQFLAMWGILALFRRLSKRENPAHPRGDFLTAAALALNGAAAHLINLALLFLLLPAWAPSRLRLALPLLVGLFFAALFAVNGVLTLRQRLTESTRWAKFAVMLIAVVLGALTAYSYIQSVLYSLISNAGVTL